MRQLSAAIKVIGHRTTAAGGGVSQPRYYISGRAAPAGQLNAGWREDYLLKVLPG